MRLGAFLVPVVASLLTLAAFPAQTPTLEVIPIQVVGVQPVRKLTPNQKPAPAILRSADTEMLAVAAFLQAQLDRAKTQADKEAVAHELSYLKFFTTYAIADPAVRIAAELCLPFCLNSVASVRSDGKIRLPRRVPGETTLWFIDIRDYGWDKKDIDAVFDLQPYHLDPILDHRLYNFGRLVAGNVLFRADWFIVNVLDTTRQDDRGGKVFPYYTLLYGLGKEPKNADEFRKFWRVDIDTIRVEGVERGTIVDVGDSGVSLHTRQLRRGRSIFGYYWETRDVKSHDVADDGKKQNTRDYIEDIFAHEVDAGEYITSHKNGLQVYLLTAGNKQQFKRVEFGDPTVVWDRSDNRDPRVRTAKGCIVCHPTGINPAGNAIRDIFLAGGNIHTRNKKLQHQIEAFYLRNDLGELIKDDNRIYERAVKACNNLSPLENAEKFLTVYEWYAKKVTPEQAAFECGKPLADYREVIRATATGRMTQLFKGKSIPRDSWDSLNAGVYTQSMLLVKRIKIEVKPVVPKPSFLVEVTAERGEVRNGKKLVVYLKKGLRVPVTSVDGDWLWVTYQGRSGYIHRGEVRVLTEKDKQ